MRAYQFVDGVTLIAGRVLAQETGSATKKASRTEGLILSKPLTYILP